MPLYEYRCTDCEATLEAIQAFAAPPLEECPECGRSSLKKLLSAPAFQFKGSGWYVNDYARKDKSPAGGRRVRSRRGEWQRLGKQRQVRGEGVVRGLGQEGGSVQFFREERQLEDRRGLVAAPLAPVAEAHGNRTHPGDALRPRQRF